MKIKSRKGKSDEDEDLKKKKKKKSGLYNGSKKVKRPRDDEDEEEDDEDEEDEDDEDDEDESPKSKKKKSRDDDDDEDDDNDWMITDRDEQKKEMRRHESEMRRNSDRPPEMWIKDGECRKIQFLSTDPLAVIFRYTVPQGGKNFLKLTAPRLGKKDLMKKAGLRSGLVAFYPVIDVTGFTDKKGKRYKNVPRYLPCSARVEKSVEKIREKKGDLTRLEIEYSRSGTSTDTTYSFFVEGKMKPHPEAQKMLKELKKKFPHYYRPPSVEEQRLVLNGATTEEDDD